MSEMSGGAELSYHERPAAHSLEEGAAVTSAVQAEGVSRERARR